MPPRLPPSPLPPKKNDGKAIRNARVCYRCARPILDDRAVACPRCGSTEIEDRKCRPSYQPRRPVPPLPFPFATLGMEPGGTMLLSGGAGSGKTTICLGLHPDRIDTSEQEPEKVAADWYRVNGIDRPAPFIHAVYTWDDLDEDTAALTEGELIVVDSVSQLAESFETVDVVRAVIERVRRAGARGIFIAQHTKDHAMLGPNELRHQVDLVVDIPHDPSGMRRVNVEKNRFGRLASVYFTISDTGVHPPAFPYAYSVEGGSGRYRLHMYPETGAKFAGLLDLLAEGKAFLEGRASAAIPCSAYRTGFAEPGDVEERKAFAESHGLTWITPAQAVEFLASQDPSALDTPPPF